VPAALPSCRTRKENAWWGHEGQIETPVNTVPQFTGKLPINSLCYFPMAGIRGKSGPPGNQNAFKHGLAGIIQRRSNSALTPDEQAIREDILAGLIADKGGNQQIGTAERILAEIISSDVALLVTFNKAIEGVISNNQKARQNPRALAQLDGYKRPLVSSLSANLQRFGMGKVCKVETLQEIIEEMDEDNKTGENSTPKYSLQSEKDEADG
jgi:hypothetical protein